MPLPIAELRTYSDAQIIVNAQAPLVDGNNEPIRDPQTGQQTTAPRFIVGFFADEARGGMIFEDTVGGDGGAQIKLFNVTEIRVAKYRNFLFVDYVLTTEERATIPPNATAKIVIPFQVAQQYGFV